MIKYSKFLKKKKFAIFLFHGVIEKNPFKVRNYTKKHLLVSEFEKILNDLKHKGKCLSMDEAYNVIKKNKQFEDYSYAITFDDGFYNNFKFAVPILKKKKLNATFYITTNFIDKNAMSWIDIIEHMVEKKNSKVKFDLYGHKLGFDKNVESKKIFLSNIRKIAKSNKNINFDKLVNLVKKKIKFKKEIKSSNSILDKKMTWKQVNLIKSESLFLIGGHTKSHPILSFLDNRTCLHEIEESIKIIKAKTGINLEHYSYPEGLKHTYGNREIRILKKNKIKICPSAEIGLNNSKSNLFHLKRIFVDRI